MNSNDQKLINIGLTLIAPERGEFPAPGAISTWVVPPFEIALVAYSPHEAAEFEFGAREIFALYRLGQLLSVAKGFKRPIP